MSADAHRDAHTPVQAPSGLEHPQDVIDDALVNSAATFRSPRMIEAGYTDAVVGAISWAPAKSLWISSMTLTALIGGPLFVTPSALALFLVTIGVSVCLGHSLGMHRRLIHRAYQCPLWMERLFVYLGVMVGMAGPFGMIRQHDIRDWAQRKSDCHPFLAHRTSIARDYFWQNHCELTLAHPPRLTLERHVSEDRVYLFLERHWRAQQLPWAMLFFACGGMPFLVWGIAVRIAAGVTGHWLVGYFAHNCGPRSWHVEGAGVQGYNVPGCGWLTMGEAWHNNHHAFPASARLGLGPAEPDPGWAVLCALHRLGLVWNLKTPESLPFRPNLVALVRGPPR
jgi:fatty-acid desaturase